MAIAAFVIGPARDAHDIYDDWARAREVEESGCVLVRPDAHVAWRANEVAEDATAELAPRHGVAARRGGANGRRNDMIDRESAAPVAPSGRDATADVVVVGGGGGGLPSALFARWLGNEVILLEKAPELGGTARKAAFWYWIPNNRPMQEAGIADPEDDFLRYTARLSRPQQYDPDGPTLGLPEWEYRQIKAIYESASPAAELLAERGALPYRWCEAVPDYWSELPEDKAPTGRVLVPKGARDTMSDGGVVGIDTLSAAAERDGVNIRVSQRVQRLVMAGGAVVGVEATGPDGTVRVRAGKAVIFASGGFTHDPELRANFLSAPVFGGCAALSNEGDFVRIGAAAGAQLRNMNQAWMCPIPLEHAVARRPEMSGMFSVAGDSMLFVDKTGRRVVNEKLPYNELAQFLLPVGPAARRVPVPRAGPGVGPARAGPLGLRRVRAADRRSK